MARVCKCITRAVISHYLAPNFPVMPTGIMSVVNARLVKREYRRCDLKCICFVFNFYFIRNVYSNQAVLSNML